MPSRSSKALLAAVTAAALLLTGCVNTAAGETPGTGGKTAASANNGTLRYAIWSNPKGTFNPLLYFTDYDRAVIFNVYSRLVVLDEKQGYQPSLAKGFEYSEDGRTLTFTLPTDVTWHDGKPLTAEDVAFTYTATADPAFPLDTPEFAQQLSGFEAYHSGASTTLEGIQVVDPQTVAFTFDKPYAAALSYFADRPVLAKHVWEGTPVAQWNDATELLTHPVGTGPFVFDKFVSDQYVSLTRNEKYFGGAPKLGSLIFKVTNAETAQTQLINGELDVAELSSFNRADLDTYETAGVKIVEQTGTSAQYLTLDTKNPKFADERVRQAVVTGINRQGIIDSLLYGHGTLFNTNAHPKDPYYPASGIDDYAFDPKRAAALLEEAGWVDSDGDGIREKGGERLTLTLNFPTGNKTRELSAPIIQSNLKDIGIDVQLVSADFNSTLAILQNPETSFDGVLMGGSFRPGQYSNNHWWERYESPALTTLATEFNSTIDDSARKKAVGEWLTEINRIALRAWLYIPNVGFAVSPTVTKFTPYPYETFNGVNEWTVKG
ncbi:ABC transporter substrate-binding protein [Mycetocola tolaasinivorans]|uniref:ABC transporter substrate-binding protein n=1 Tax=Mycetocola tolaasinivorans TaxID=76635 RepID=A0A3L7A5R0_9MICO|nr:ABC transporter substrate-binding protein [Mycetocola tolaasinivorans]RLP75673.1 ABC transporter substrate-binding protein [Mycetocola tolaasinivorans]